MIAVGLELTDRSARAVALQRQGARLRLVNAIEVPVDGGSAAAVVDAIKRVRKALPIKQPVVVGLPTRLAVVTTVEPLIVNTKRAGLAVRFELQERLPYDAAQAIWQYRWLNGTSKHAVVAALKRSLLEERIALCRQGGLAVREVGVACVAAVNAWVRQLGSPQTFHGILLHVDGAIQEWIVIDDAGLRVFPMMEASLKDSWEGLRDLLGIPATAPRQTVWVLGETTGVSRVSEVLKQELGCLVELVSPSRLVQAGDGKAGELEPLAVACGLALQGLGVARLPMNLLRDIAERRTLLRIRRTTTLVSWILALATAAVAAGGALAIVRRKRQVLERVTAQERVYQQLRPEIRAMLQRQAQYEERLRQIEQVLTARPLVIRALREVVNMLPDEMWLTKIELSKGPMVEGTVDGYARSFQGVTRLMDQLKASAGWTTVKLLGTSVTTDPKSGKELVIFTVQVQQPLPLGKPAVEAPAERPRAGKAGKGAPQKRRDARGGRSGAGGPARASQPGSAKPGRGEP